MSGINKGKMLLPGRVNVYENAIAVNKIPT